MAKRSKIARTKSLAQRADRHKLYQRSVQVPEHEAWLLDRIHKRAFGKPARVLREDFCGTFAVCCEWVKRGKDRRAIGVDLDPEPLAWGRKHNLSRLKEAAQGRVQLMQEDVRRVVGPKADIVTAENFSFWIFKTRPELREYFRAARANLARRGVLVLDMMGGGESMAEDHQDFKSYRGFEYVWDQARFDPITHHCTNHIHFRFPDRSELKRAFTYHWRFWTLPEVRELLLEAGFRDVHVYWEDTNRRTGKGTDVYRIRKHADGDPAWICYVAAVK